MTFKLICSSALSFEKGDKGSASATLHPPPIGFLDLKPSSCEAVIVLLGACQSGSICNKMLLHTLTKYLSSHYFHLKVSKHLKHGLSNDVWVDKMCYFKGHFTFLRTPYWLKTKGRKALCKAKTQLQGVSNLCFCFVHHVASAFFLLAVRKHEWNNSMRIGFFYPWIWQDAKAIILLKHLIGYAKRVRNFNNFQKYGEETRKLNLNSHIIHVQ